MRRSALLPLSFSLLAACASEETPQPRPDTGGTRPAAQAPRLPRAADGDTVVVAVNRVRPDRRAQFEQFIETISSAGVRPGALDSLSTAVFTHTRTLYPTTPDSDGTLHYLFIFDPIIPGASYDIEKYVGRLFPQSDSARIVRLYRESLARPQQSLGRVVQRYPRP